MPGGASCEAWRCNHGGEPPFGESNEPIRDERGKVRKPRVQVVDEPREGVDGFLGFRLKAWSDDANHRTKRRSARRESVERLREARAADPVTRAPVDWFAFENYADAPPERIVVRREHSPQTGGSELSRITEQAHHL